MQHAKCDVHHIWRVIVLKSQSPVRVLRLACA
jgi:hypothetical protein